MFRRRCDSLFAGVYGSTPAGDIDHKHELIAHIMRENGLERDRCVRIGTDDTTLPVRMRTTSARSVSFGAMGAKRNWKALAPIC